MRHPLWCCELIHSHEHPPCRYQGATTATLADNNDLGVCHCHETVLSLNQLLHHHSREYATSASCFIQPIQTTMSTRTDQHSYTTKSLGDPFRTWGVWIFVPSTLNTRDMRSTFRTQDTASSQGARIPWGDPWSDGDGQEPELVQNWLLIKIFWAHPHLPNRTSGVLEQQQNCRVADDRRVRSRRPPGTHSDSDGRSQIPQDSLSYRGQA